MGHIGEEKTAGRPYHDGHRPVEYDVRVSSIPTVYGEKIVMRLTNKEKLTRDKRELGLSDDDMKRFDQMLAHPHGIILVTGPTGMQVNPRHFIRHSVNSTVRR